MSFLLKNAFHTDLTQNFIDDVQLGKSSYYYFLGKIVNWGSTDAPPVSQTETLLSESGIRSEIISLKKLSSSDVSMVIPRYDWAPGQVWDMWDSTKDMTGKKFYVMNDQFNVYKCLSNNNGVVSSNKPQDTPLNTFTTNDGYIWKYMYTIPLSKRNRFISGTKIPVQRSISDFFYNNGSVSSVAITSGGSSYVSTLACTINVTGGTPTTPASFIPLISSVDGSLKGVRIVSGGSGYVSAPTLALVSSTGSGSGLYGSTATMVPVVQGGVVVSVMISDPGQNYPSTKTTTITVVGDGTGAAFTPIVYNGSITDVVVDNPGSGYTYMSLVVNATTGSGAVLLPNIPSADLSTDQSIVESTAVAGAIHRIMVTQSGTFYTTAQVTIQGDGTGCTASPVITNGLITDITVLTPGSGYTYANVVITGNNITNNPTAASATAYAILPPQGGHGKNAPLELMGNTVCMFSQIRYTSTNNLPASQDFRQYGLLRNPRDLYTGSIVSKQTANSTFKVALTGYYSLAKDQVLVSGTKRYRVVEFTNSYAVLLPLNNTVLVVSDVLHPENDLVTTYTVIQVLSTPEFNKYTGEMIYTCDDYSFAFSSNESITIKTYLTL
jgi:hypothetical protein